LQIERIERRAVNHPGEIASVAPENQKSETDIAEFWSAVDRVVEFCRQNAGEIDYEGAFPEQEFQMIGESGLLAAPVEAAHGGLGFGVEPGRGPDLLTLLKRIGYGNLTVGRLYEGHTNALQLIQTYGTAEQRERFSRDAVEHRRVFGVWNTEMADGVKISPIDEGRYRLDGSKTFASGAGRIDRPLVTGALPDGGWQIFIVPVEQVATQIDESWWKPLGMRSSATFKIDFTGVELTEAELIGQPGDYHRTPWFTGGAARFAAVQLGGAEALFDETRWFLQKVKRTEDPFQRQRMGLAQIAVESGDLWLKRAGQMLDLALTADSDPEFEQITTYAGMFRTAVEQIALDMIRWSQQSVGAPGLARPQPFERLIRDLTMYLRQPAPDATLVSVGAYTLDREEPAHRLWTLPDEV
jgi:alkylation response protein AidB-like acyl-CoA dehydrogenase